MRNLLIYICSFALVLVALNAAEQKFEFKKIQSNTPSEIFDVNLHNQKTMTKAFYYAVSKTGFDDSIQNEKELMKLLSEAGISLKQLPDLFLNDGSSVANWSEGNQMGWGVDRKGIYFVLENKVYGLNLYHENERKAFVKMYEEMLSE